MHLSYLLAYRGPDVKSAVNLIHFSSKKCSISFFPWLLSRFPCQIVAKCVSYLSCFWWFLCCLEGGCLFLPFIRLAKCLFWAVRVVRDNSDYGEGSSCPEVAQLCYEAFGVGFARMELGVCLRLCCYGDAPGPQFQIPLETPCFWGQGWGGLGWLFPVRASALCCRQQGALLALSLPCPSRGSNY